jgi:glycosyltransferase involved in cell wall biosynthesis
MNLLLSLEHRFERSPGGCVWTETAFPRSFYSPYLEIFDSVTVVARVRAANAPTASARRADGEGVSFHDVPYYVGPLAFLKKFREISRVTKAALESNDAVILRVGSQIASHLEPDLYRSDRPYALEVVSDPYEAFAPGCNDHLLRPLFRMYLSSRMKRQCFRAPGISYVTEKSLQSNYPPGAKAFCSHYSDVDLPAEAYATAVRVFREETRPMKIITVASLEQLYKGVDVLIDAVRENVNAGFDLTLQVIGDGQHRKRLEERAAPLGKRAEFLGKVAAGAAVRERLQNADIFVLASRTEGLPRALVEAMATALPCVGSAVGGIPELLAAVDLTPAGDAAALALKLREIIREPERLTATSERNLAKAQEYRREVLRARRLLFYSELRRRTEEWLTRNRN